MLRSRKSVCSWITLIVIYLSGCDSTPRPAKTSVESGASDESGVNTPLSFDALFEGYLRPQCSQEACHGGARGVAGLRLVDVDEAYESLIEVTPTNASASEAGMARVKPSDLEASLLWAKLTLAPEVLSARGLGAAMPLPGGMSPGSRTQEHLRAWILAGARREGASPSDRERAFDLSEPPSADRYVRCSIDDDSPESDLRECFSPPEDSSALRLYTPKLVIPPHSEQLICSYLDMPVDEPIYVNRTVGQQMTGGHHAAVFLAVSPSDEPPHECRDDEMSNFRFAAGAGGGGGQDTQLPLGVALRIEPGQQFVIQSHYLNPSDQPVIAMDAVDLVTIPESEVVARVDPFAMLHGGFEVPTGGEPFEVRKRCRLERDLDVYMLLGHTHDYGVLFEMYHHTPLLDMPRKLYHATDGPLLRDNPEIKYFDPPLSFQEGDVLEMVCVWENTSDAPLRWPEEMCVGLMYYGPGQGWMTCGEDDEVPKLPSPESGMGCVSLDAPGNELGIGRACTAQGGECAGAERASLCLATFDARANFCSFLGCVDDEECGEGASCLAQGPATACVPQSCAE